MQWRQYLCPVELRLLPAAGKSLSKDSFLGVYGSAVREKTAAEKKKLQTILDGFVQAGGGSWGPAGPSPPDRAGSQGCSVPLVVLHPRSSRLSGVQGAGGAGCNAGITRCTAVLHGPRGLNSPGCALCATHSDPPRASDSIKSKRLP